MTSCIQKDNTLSSLTRLISGVIISLAFIAGGLGTVPQALAADPDPPTWRRIRCNSVPYMPATVAVDASGDVWVAARADSENDPGAWHRPAADPNGRFYHHTNDRANNYLVGDANNVVVKEQLDADVLYVIRDDAGNTWYSLNDRRVLCEKAGGGWETFNLYDSSSLGGDTSNVDSAHTIRLIDNPSGGQNALLIANRSISKVTPDFSWEELRYESLPYNNYFIKDAYIDSQGRCWVANEYGVQVGSNFWATEFPAAMAQYENDPEVPPYDPFEVGSPFEAVIGIEEDSAGNMWFINNLYGSSGVYCLTPPNGTDDWLIYDVDALAGASNRITKITSGQNGGMWFSPLNDGIVHRALDGSWTPITCTDLGLVSNSVISMDEKDGVLWFVTDTNPNYGTGVHALTLSGRKAPTLQHTYEYRENSTTLTSHRIDAMTADLSGGVWFGGYDDPSIARMKADGSWVQ